MPKISFTKLGDKDTAEAKRLFEACRAEGFLLLDLKGSEKGEVLLQDAVVGGVSGHHASKLYGMFGPNCTFAPSSNLDAHDPGSYVPLHNNAATAAGREIREVVCDALATGYLRCVNVPGSRRL